MIKIIISEIFKIDTILDKAIKDMDIDFNPKSYDFQEIFKCSKLMAFRLSKEFKGAIFNVQYNVQYKGGKKFDIYIKSPFIDGVYKYNAGHIIRNFTPSRVEV